jgi:hypothetical protein
MNGVIIELFKQQLHLLKFAPAKGALNKKTYV